MEVNPLSRMCLSGFEGIHMHHEKTIRIVLLVLIIIGLGLLASQIPGSIQ